MKRTAADVERYLTTAKAIRSLQGHPGWQALEGFLKEMESSRVESLVSLIPESDTARLRAEIRVIRSIVRIATISESEISKAAEELERLADLEKRREAFGLNQPT